MTKVLRIRDCVLSPKCDIYLTYLPSGNILKEEPERTCEAKDMGEEL